MNRGRLIYVIGPSGAGKDSVLREARLAVAERNVLFAHRYITRPADAGGENHVALSEQEFSHRVGRGCFSMHWQSHGFDYGIGREIDLWMGSGFTVVVNGSRGYLPEALVRYPQLVPVLITAAPDVLEARLKGRGRETDEHVRLRLQRAKTHDVSHPKLVRIENNGQLAEAAAKLIAVLREPVVRRYPVRAAGPRQTDVERVFRR